MDCEDNGDCSDGSFCRENVCAPDVCEADGTTCEGDELLTCSADGSGFIAATCEDGCAVNDGVAACEGAAPMVCAGGTADPCSSIPKYPWPTAVAPMTADKVIGFDVMIGVNDDPAPSSTREFEYGLFMDGGTSASCASAKGLWCDNGLWCTPTTAD